jgi:hypothetical protein
MGIPSPTGASPPVNSSIDNNASYYLTRPMYAGYVQDTWRVSNHLTVDIGLRYEVQIPWLERYNRMASQFNINAVNPDSSQILAAWNADAATYNATNPKYPYPSAPPAIWGVWQFAGQNGLRPGRVIRIGPMARCASASRTGWATRL